MTSQTEKKEIALRDKEEITRDQGEITREGRYFTPQVDIYEADQGITILADLPGVNKENLDIDLRDSTLTITGHVKSLEERFKASYSEYEIGGYLRRFTLSDKIDQDRIHAELSDGVLKLELPKAEKLQPRDRKSVV